MGERWDRLMRALSEDAARRAERSDERRRAAQQKLDRLLSERENPDG